MDYSVKAAKLEYVCEALEQGGQWLHDSPTDLYWLKNKDGKFISRIFGKYLPEPESLYQEKIAAAVKAFETAGVKKEAINLGVIEQEEKPTSQVYDLYKHREDIKRGDINDQLIIEQASR